MNVFELIESDTGLLTLRRPDQEDVVDVRLRRAFPWTHADELISVRSDKGKELVLIQRLADLPPAQRQVVERWFTANAFIPLIRRVESVNTDYGHQLWDVETDRGPTTFRVQEREDIRFLPDGRFSIKDVDGNVYSLPRLDQLDPASVKAVEALL
jgi:hypothetical protein